MVRAGGAGTVSDDLLPRDWRGEPVERSLIDDLASVLSRTVVGWEPIIGEDLAQAPEVQRVLARYRQETADEPTLAADSAIVLCEDPDCDVAWAYKDPPREHYHPRPHGPEVPR